MTQALHNYMLSEETKILFKNIKTFRRLITEAVGQNDMEKYINNHEFIYIYYAGDGENKRGWRTIRPYVLGTSSKDGGLLLRAWQDLGKSTSKSLNLRGNKHDYWTDNSDGKVKAGWRMFRLDKIEQLLPIGKKFNYSNGSVMIPPDYKEGSDKGMASIIAYVSTEKAPVQLSGSTEPAVQTNQRVGKWDRFQRANNKNRKITSDDVLNLRKKVRDVLKEKIGNFNVVINDRNEFEIIRAKDINNVPKQAIVGSLANLYDTMVKQPTSNDSFFKIGGDKLKSQLSNQNNQTNNTQSPTNSLDRKSFFKQ